MPKHPLGARALAILSTSLLICLPMLGADGGMKVTDNGYLDTRGFSVILYQSTYHPVFVDQKNTAMELILHGQRVATNGDVRLMPTPEQWDLVAQLKGRQADKEHNRLTAQLSFPAYQMDYELVVTPEPGGVRVSVNLARPLPEKLAGRAGFNLEFLPPIYMDKSYSVDNKMFGVIPRSPEDAMQVVPRNRDDPMKLPYQEQWDKDKGYTQPLPIVTGNSITLAPEDRLNRVSISSDTAPVSLYDGRSRAQNGWFVLRSLIPAGKTEGAIVWHIHPDLIPDWIRPPVVAHSQLGYAPEAAKVSLIELDPNFDAPKTAKLLRLQDDGSYKQVFEAPVSAPTLTLREIRLLRRQGSRAVCHRVCGPADRSVSHWQECVQPLLAGHPGRLPGGGDGSCFGPRGLPPVAWCFASRRCQAGTAERAALRRVPHGS